MNRYTKITAIRKKFISGQASVGSWIQIPHTSIAEIFGAADYDWVAIDLEHGSISLHQVPDLCRALELGGTLPIARVSASDITECRQVLDAGAGGVIIPNLEEAHALEQIRDNCRWPPAGKRGVGFCRGNLYGLHFSEYKEEAQSPLLVAQIESSRAVQNLESILAVKGLDAVFIGPYDLSASMGITGDFENPQFVKIINKILNSCKEHGVPAGIHVIKPDRKEVEAKIESGYQFIAHSIDSVMLQLSVIKDEL